MSDSKSYDILFKIVFVGLSKVGKSAIVSRYVDNMFSMRNQTIHPEFHVRNVVVDNIKVSLQIWDQGGCDRYMNLGNLFYRNAKGVFMVFDICKRDSFEYCQSWFDTTTRSVNKYNGFKPEKCVYYLIGNKTDLALDRQVTIEEAEQFSKSNNIKYLETSAKEATGLILFESITRDMLLKHTEMEPTSSISLMYSKSNSTASYLSTCC
ncbi:Rab GTPase [Tieghemostelium lacteum]|uniref:Rab GTPase n=1 Tax=Tieghemostelium lacteum TaxID=361077 RepID=A0A151Z477_TIELA|nr:Rab GTPase [Tieghemostelium lacteum]|eukprot:KYQ88751.1 Rab GTPase [Tieghemostelium lacteum]